MPSRTCKHVAGSDQRSVRSRQHIVATVAVTNLLLLMAGHLTCVVFVFGSPGSALRASCRVCRSSAAALSSPQSC